MVSSSHYCLFRYCCLLFSELPVGRIQGPTPNYAIIPLAQLAEGEHHLLQFSWGIHLERCSFQCVRFPLSLLTFP